MAPSGRIGKKFLGLGLTIIGTLIFAFIAGSPAWAQNRPGKTGRVGCPHCTNDGSPISQLLHRSDELYASFKTKEAMGTLLKVLELAPQNYEALSKMARVYIDLGDMIPETEAEWQAEKLKQYETAQQYARQAAKADPNGTWGHFYIAASLGKIAMMSSIPKQIDLSHEIQAEVEKSIALDPQNGFAYHVYGVWHRKVAEIGKMSRLTASVLLWRTVPQASIERSEEYLNKAISLNPRVIVHRLELAKTLLVMNKPQQARTNLQPIFDLPVQFSDDGRHKKEARQLLQEINGR
ncbi:MAG: tetratricopeptide repeat protein [Candidatus Binatia bacterium]